MKTLLNGHNSEKTAYIIDDYPFGFRLRCKKRVWIETVPKKGQRLVEQTTDPRRTAEYWNKPKKSVYSDLMVMYLDENNHVQTDTLSATYADAEKIEAFLNEYASILTSKYEQDMVLVMKITASARRHMDRLTAGKNIYDFPIEERRRILLESKRLAFIENKGA